MSDSYPEYLNPFAEDLKPKPKSAIRSSFKEFRRSLRQSFRIKKKDEDEVMIRQKSDTLRRPVTYSNAPTEALPRSRFRERLTRTEPDRSSQNPFEEDEEADQRTKLTLSRKKPKKRAPLPPKSLSSQNINDENLDVPTGGSHWSLTSVETDYSGLASHEESGVGIKRESLVDKFADFNKNMEELKDDTNNNNITSKEDTEQHNVPDLVISCPSDFETSRGEEEKEEEMRITLSRQEEKEQEVEEVEEKEGEEKKEKRRTSNVSENEETKSDVSAASSQDLCVKDISDNLIVEEPFLYHEKKSIYIPGSKDELNTSNETDVYTGTVSLYITGSCDELNISNNNEVCDKKIIHENGNDDTVPVPKQRKNKLTKNILLGM